MPDKKQTRLIWLLWIYLAAYGAWAVAMLAGLEPRARLNDLLFFPFYLAAAAASLHAARATDQHPSISRGWKLIAAAWGASALGAALWMLHAVRPLGLLDQTAWLLYNAYYPITLVGLWCFFERPRAGESWLRLLVEGAIVATATTVLAWYFVFRFHQAVVGATRWLDLVAILLAGETLVMIAASGVLHRPRQAASIRVLTTLAIGIFLAGIADFVYEQNDLIGSTWSGPGGDLVLGFGATLIATAGLMRSAPRARPALVATGLSLLPYLAVTTVAALLVYESVRANLGRGPIAGLIIGGAVLLVLVIARLLVAQRELLAETAARSAQDARFRLLVQQSADAIVVATNDGTIRYASPAFARMVGADAGTVEDRTLLDYVAPRSRALVAGWLARGPNDPLGGWQLGRDGAWLDVEAAGADLSADPVIAGIVLNIRDMTGRLRLEAELRQAQKLEVAGRLSSSIAHDFNNLLTVIIGSLQLARVSANPHTLDAAEAAAHRGATLARQLLSLSKPGASPGGGADLGDAIRAVERTLRNVLPTSIELVVTTPMEPLPVGICVVQIEQILLNLALNARDAMLAGGRLSVTAQLVAGTGRREDGAARIVVSDTGVGMSEEALAHAFEPFFTTKAAGLGTGLGLSTVHRIVSEAGGRVELDSPPEGGTVVTMTLPLRTRAPDAGADPSAAPVRRGHGRILLVDDETAVRQVIAALLDRRGYEVIEAPDGMAALDTLSTGPGGVDLVLTDLVMPRLGGEELCRRLQATHPTLPLLCMSGTPGVGTGTSQPWSAGAVIGKPIDIEDLAARIEAALGTGGRGANN